MSGNKRYLAMVRKAYIVYFVSYINNKDNYEADYLSRERFQDIEWELGDYDFEQITHKFGQFDVDSFASRCNAKYPTYVTWLRDPDVWAVDAWENKYFYAFPPFGILKMLRKIMADKAESVFIVPHWSTQPWCPLQKKKYLPQMYFILRTKY